MTRVHALDPLTFPLVGQQLIEASAGTGRAFGHRGKAETDRAHVVAGHGSGPRMSLLRGSSLRRALSRPDHTRRTKDSWGPA